MPVNGWNETRADGPDLSIVRTGTVVRVSVRGEVDATDGGELERALVAAVHAAASVEIDLAGVSFFGSYGVRALVAAWVAAQRVAVRLAVALCRWKNRRGSISKPTGCASSGPRSGAVSSS